MITLRSPLLNTLTTLLSYSYRNPRPAYSFKRRLRMYSNRLDRFDRQFHMRPPSLQTKNVISFPITVPFRLRHRYNPKKQDQFVDDSSRIHWNRLTPNQILLGFENIQYLEYNQMMEGLRYLSEVKGQEQHDWNSHPWISKALEQVNTQFFRIKKNDHISVYYLMKKLRCSSPEFWKKMYNHIEQHLYDLYPHEFQNFFLRYYKISDQYFSPEMKQKFITLLEGRLRSFSPQSIIKVYEIFQDEGRLDDYWKYNVFVPLFKSQQYTYCPEDLHKIFRFMLVIGHEKDDRLYNSLYKRLMSYEELTGEQLGLLEEVIQEIKDLFVSHRVDPYVAHLKEMRKKMKKANAGKKKEIPLHELVRQDLVFLLHKRKIQAEEAIRTVKSQDQNNRTRSNSTAQSIPQ